MTLVRCLSHFADVQEVYANAAGKQQAQFVIIGLCALLHILVTLVLPWRF